MPQRHPSGSTSNWSDPNASEPPLLQLDMNSDYDARNHSQKYSKPHAELHQNAKSGTVKTRSNSSSGGPNTVSPPSASKAPPDRPQRTSWLQNVFSVGDSPPPKVHPPVQTAVGFNIPKIFTPFDDIGQQTGSVPPGRLPLAPCSIPAGKQAPVLPSSSSESIPEPILHSPPSLVRQGSTSPASDSDSDGYAVPTVLQQFPESYVRTRLDTSQPSNKPSTYVCPHNGCRKEYPTRLLAMTHWAAVHKASPSNYSSRRDLFLGNLGNVGLAANSLNSQETDSVTGSLPQSGDSSTGPFLSEDARVGPSMYPPSSARNKSSLSQESRETDHNRLLTLCEGAQFLERVESAVSVRLESSSQELGKGEDHSGLILLSEVACMVPKIETSASTCRGSSSQKRRGDSVNESLDQVAGTGLPVSVRRESFSSGNRGWDAGTEIRSNLNQSPSLELNESYYSGTRDLDGTEETRSGGSLSQHQTSSLEPTKVNHGGSRATVRPSPLSKASDKSLPAGNRPSRRSSKNAREPSMLRQVLEDNARRCTPLSSALPPGLMNRVLSRTETPPPVTHSMPRSFQEPSPAGPSSQPGSSLDAGPSRASSSQKETKPVPVNHPPKPGTVFRCVVQSCNETFTSLEDTLGHYDSEHKSTIQDRAPKPSEHAPLREGFDDFFGSEEM